MSDKKFLYNKQINYVFIPTLDGDPISISGVTSARLYSSNPTLQQKLNTTAGYIEEVTSGITTTTGLDYTQYNITFSSVNDPNPDSDDLVPYNAYYVVVNFNADASSVETFSDEVIYLYRADSFQSYLDTTVSDLISYENKLDSELENSQLENHIRNSKKELFFILKNKGYSKRLLFNFVDSLKQLHIYLALSACCRDLSSENSDRWNQKADTYDKKFWSLLNSAKISTDLSGIDEPSPNDHVSGGVIHILR